MDGRWPVAAVLSMLCLLTAWVFMPWLFGANRFAAPFVPAFRPFLLLLAGVFALIALFKYFRERRALSLHPKTPMPAAVARQAATPGTRTVPPVRTQETIPAAGASGPVPVLMQWSLDVIQRMEWKRFEDVCAEIYRAKGIHCNTTSLGADGGVDVRLYQDSEDPGRCTAIVQCKSLSQAVGVKLVRELRGVMAHEKIEKAFYMASGGYTEDARAFAAENRITLLDGKLLLAMIQRLPADTQQKLLAFATQGDWTIPTCSHCGTKMVERAGKAGKFWGCANYPRCRQILKMRGEK